MWGFVVGGGMGCCGLLSATKSLGPLISSTVISTKRRLGSGGGGAGNALVVRCGGTAAGLVRSPGEVEKEYKELNLSPLYATSYAGRIRIRQHVNPLKHSFTKPVELPEWNEAFEDPTLPLLVDIGCGSGRFLLWLARNSSVSRNYLGLEIRQKLVQRSQFWATELGLRNIHFLFANATMSFDLLVSSYPGPLSFVSILCPDPHFKKKHHKRRVVQEPLVISISKNLSLGGRVLLQSDVHDVAFDMRNLFETCSDIFDHVDSIDPGFRCDADGWLSENPMGIRTEREIHAELEGAKIYRRMYQKCRNYEQRIDLTSATEVNTVNLLQHGS